MTYEDQINEAFERAEKTLQRLSESRQMSERETIAIMLAGVARAVQDSFLAISSQIEEFVTDSQP